MTLAIAFFGGLLSCISPCVLPVIPVFVSTIAGSPVTASTTLASARLRGLGFLLGFAGVFVALWVSLGMIGYALFDTVPLARVVGGITIVGLGLATILGWQPMLRFGRLGRAGSFGGSFLLGTGVAVGWTPCVGPTLGAVLTLAAASPTVWAGGALLAAYALGMALAIAAIGLGLSRFRPLAGLLRDHRRAIEVASGMVIVGVGILVATSTFGRLAGLVPWPF